MKKFGFPKSDRLHLTRDFDRVRRSPHRASGRILSVRAWPNGTGRSRLGLSVGRGAGNAVQRNQLKRLVREAFRLQRDRIPAGWDLVVAIRGAGTSQPTLAGISGELTELAEKACAGNPNRADGS